MRNIFNKKMSGGKIVTFWAFGIIIGGIALVGAQNYPAETLEQHLCLLLSSIAFVLGVELLLLTFNFENVWSRGVLLAGVLAFFVLVLLCEIVCDFSIYCIVCIVIIIIILSIKKFFSTMVTFIVFMYVDILIIYILSQKYSSLEHIIFYTGIVLLIILYRILGVKVNRIFIGTFMGFKEESKEYNIEQLKEQMNVMHLILFLALNLSNWFYDSNVLLATILNNGFVTGIAIININWAKIFGKCQTVRLTII